MTKEEFCNIHQWRPSPNPKKPHNIIRWLPGKICATINYRNGSYAGVYNDSWTDSYSTQQEAINALYGKLPRDSAPPPPPPPAPEPKPAPKKSMTLAEHILKAGDGDYEVGYRRLAKRFHPDAGGSHELMLELNAAIEKIRKAYVN
jgi:hypothetical protein